MEMPAEQRREMARGKALQCLFFEPSTRTRLSFQSAMALIGGTSFGIADATSSSVQKGESLADTVRIMAGYTDAVLRHSLDGSSKFASGVFDKPLINADMVQKNIRHKQFKTCIQYKKNLEKLMEKILELLRLKVWTNSFSLLYGLSNYDVNVHLISPELESRSDSTYKLKENLSFTESDNLDEYIERMFVCNKNTKRKIP